MVVLVPGDQYSSVTQSHSFMRRNSAFVTYAAPIAEMMEHNFKKTHDAGAVPQRK